MTQDSDPEYAARLALTDQFVAGLAAGANLEEVRAHDSLPDCSEIRRLLSDVLVYADLSGSPLLRREIERALASEPAPTLDTPEPPSLDVERIAEMAVMSLGEFVTMPEVERLFKPFRASFAARLRRADEYRRSKR